jgi:RimJ/RimL family protein N-acetyltransferase
VTAFTTERLVLRAPEVADEGSYATLFAEPRVAAWLRPPPLRPFTVNDAALAIDADQGRWAADGYGLGVLEDRAGGTFLGRGGIQATTVAGERHVELGWALLPPFWGRGLATEMALGAIAWARDVLAIPELVAFTLPGNRASRRVMEKAGLAYERDVEHAGLAHALYRLTLG